jgi:glycogenin glucosyltransferase
MINNTNLPKAYVTLVTNNSYISGAIVLGYSLRSYNTSHLIICLVTSEVDPAYIAQLSKVFDHVINIPKLDSHDSKRLDLLGRPELGITFSKLHVWNMTWLSQILFLDADTLVLKNIDHLFSQYENTHFAACPDIGWPDCFNSGVFMCKPSHQIYTDLIKLSQDKGSFDGGDQGLLNSYFNSWSRDQKQRIPFTYNVTPNAVYSYAPAYQQYQSDIFVLHFIGESKPWNLNRKISHNYGSQSNRNSGIVENKRNQPVNLSNRWWETFDQLPEEITKQTNSAPPVNQLQNHKEENIGVIVEKNVTNEKIRHNENYSRHPFDNIFKTPKQEPPHISSLPDNYFRPLEYSPSADGGFEIKSDGDLNPEDQLLTDAHQVSKHEPFPLFEAYKKHRPKRQSQKKSIKAPPQSLTPDYHRPNHIDIKHVSHSSILPPNTTSPHSTVRLIGTKFNRTINKPIVTDKGTYLTEYQVTVESDSPIDDNYLNFRAYSRTASIGGAFN